MHGSSARASFLCVQEILRNPAPGSIGFSTAAVQQRKQLSSRTSILRRPSPTPAPGEKSNTSVLGTGRNKSGSTESSEPHRGVLQNFLYGGHRAGHDCYSRLRELPGVHRGFDSGRTRRLLQLYGEII